MPVFIATCATRCDLDAIETAKSSMTVVLPLSSGLAQRSQRRTKRQVAI